MINRKKRGLAILLTLLMSTTLSGGFCYAGENTESNAAASVEVQTSLSNEKSISSKKDGEKKTENKSSYSLDDYSTRDIIIGYKDGSIETAHCLSDFTLKRKLSQLEKNSSVKFYQPDFKYASENVQVTPFENETESFNNEGMNIYYGAPGEQEKILKDIEKNANSSIADFHPVVPMDPYFFLQWSLYNDGSFNGGTSGARPQAGIDIGALEAWNRYRAKKEVVIALVDTGVDYTNSDMSENLWVNAGEIPDNGIDDDGNGYIDDVNGWNFYNNNNQTYVGAEDDHGTHCASTMVAASNWEGISGVADYSNIKVMNVKALGGKDGSGTTLSVMKAIQYAEQNGASICNLSLGTPVNDHLLYKTMSESKMLFVIAAGNSSSPKVPGRNIDEEPCYPASYTLDNIITVANMTSAGDIQISSNYGADSVDIAAPGADILGYVTGEKLSFMSGTSMAAPLVSAAAAMVYTASEDRTLADTAMILKKTAQPLWSLYGWTSTGAMLDMAAAINWK